MYADVVAVALFVAGLLGIVRSRHLMHTVVCLSVSQAGTYVLLLAIGYQRSASAPVFGSGTTLRQARALPVVDPVVQALALTDIVVSATVTSLLLALALQVVKREGTTDPDRLTSLRG